MSSATLYQLQVAEVTDPVVLDTFVNTTQISFTLPQSASVRLEVFNSQGQPVRVLAEGQLHAGVLTYAFDGAALSSGVYLLTTPDIV